MIRPALALALLALSGCGGAPQWQRPDTGPEQLRLDHRLCEREAAAQAEREFYNGPSGTRAPLVHVDPARGDIRDSSAQSRRAASLSETSRRNALIRQCMLKHGYRQDGE